MRRTVAFLLTLLAAGSLVLASVFVLTTTMSTATTPPRSGPKVPEGPRFDVEYGKRYDVHCTLGGASVEYREAEILGFTSEGIGPGGATRASGSASVGFSSPSYSSGEYRYFDRWLVLRTREGKMAFVPPSGVNYLEEPRPGP